MFLNETQNVFFIAAVVYKKKPKEDWCCDLCGTVTKYKARHMASAHKVSDTVFIGYCDYHLVTLISDIVTIFPITKGNFSTAASLPCDYLLVY